jgi:hypothetical protein
MLEGMHARLGLGFGLLLVCAGCTCTPSNEGAVRVVVLFDGFTPGCLEVLASEAAGQGQSAKLSTARDALSGGKATYAIYRKTGWAPELNLRVRSYEGACTGAPLEDIAHEGSMTVVPGVVGEWVVTLHAVDADGDGYAASAPGVNGTDCDDQAPKRNPGAAEDCAGAVDLNCNNLVGCADPACLGITCDDHQACTVQDVCRADGGCGGVSAVCGTPANQCQLATGACVSDGGCTYDVEVARPCDAGTGLPASCRSDGTCASGQTNCADGLDYLGNGLVDCQDTACLNQACDAGDGCVVQAKCNGSQACVGVARTCLTPPAGECWVDAGQCIAGDCSYPSVLGRACGVVDACSVAGSCNLYGDCLGAGTKGCAAPAACREAGVCNPQDGGCTYAVSVGAGCNDGVACTAGDTCQGDGTCAGAAYSCAASSECYAAGACQGDGGCAFTVRTGQTCTNGICLADAGCLSFAPFPYFPANFIPSAFTPDAGVNLTCAAGFDSDGTGTFTGGCWGLPPVHGLIDVTGLGEPVMVLATPRLTITNTGSLTLTGGRPVVLAIYGDAVIDGPIYANSTRGNTPGAGADRAGCGLQAGQNGTRSANNNRGGGGGGAGNATVGGIGGRGENSMASQGPAGLAGVAAFTPLRGGCPGGLGGGGSNSVQAAAGSGGGALQVSAAGVLWATSTMTASAAGGDRGDTAGSNFNPGGGGAGSAGTVLLEANELRLSPSCRLTANGGAGGGGAEDGPASNGADGEVSSGAVALGGARQGGGGNGGDGGSVLGPPTPGQNSWRGGGGGGGAAGFIFLRQAAAAPCLADAGVISPAAIRQNCP